MATGSGFVHLHVHSSYSLLEGAMTIATLAKLAVADAQPALALTDTNNLFGALEFSEKLASVGVQPIIGLQLSIECGDLVHDARRAVGAIQPHLVLLAMDETGYASLLRLSSLSHLDPELGQTPRLRLSQVTDCAGGLICLTGGVGGPIDMALAQGRVDLAAARLSRLEQAFGNRLYVEVQRWGQAHRLATESDLLDLAYARGLGIVGSTEPFFAAAHDHEAHDALLAIAEGRFVSGDDRRKVAAGQFFAGQAEMARRFDDIPEAVTTTLEVAQRCTFRPQPRRSILPPFVAESGLAEPDELRRQARQGLRLRLDTRGEAPGVARQTYEDRLDYELSVIESMKFPGYFLIVADFIGWAKRSGIPVGPGRGSGAGSVVAYALGITDIDPLRFGLLFERFLNPDRVSMPDFDIDFCQDRREEVITYVRQRYGDDRVAQIITFGTLLARGVMRDVGRVLEMPYGQVDRLTKLVPQTPGKITPLAEAIAGEPKLQAAATDEPIVGRMLEIARKLEGLHRHASTHAAGVVIGDRPLQELVPLSRDPRTGGRVTQFNMKWVEQAGLVKFDFLGLKTLTVLQTALALLAKRGVVVDLDRLPLDDPPTYALLARGETVGVFQVESAGMRRALVDMKADRIEDLIALVALYRPGPMDNIPTYCRRKLGIEQPTYLHQKLEPYLAETHGIIVYQEQVMQVAQALSGYSLGEADLLRRAMGKKVKAEMDAQRGRFVSGAVANGLDEKLSSEIFDLLAKFADYGFNKSHAAAYALVSFQTAYLKANYPVEFMAASMTLDRGNTDKLAEFRRDAQRAGIVVEPPCINRSGVYFDVAEGRILYALSAIKGVGEEAVEALVSERERGGPFVSLSDLGRRLDPRKVNRKTLEALVCAGALDALLAERSRIFAGVEGLMALAQHAREHREGGQSELFGNALEDSWQPPDAAPWSPAERLRREHAAVGFYLSGHPLDEFRHVLTRLKVVSFAQFAAQVRHAGAAMGKVAASITDRTERRTRNGSKMGIVQCSDQSGHFEVIVFAEGLQAYRDLLEPGATVVLRLSASLDGDEVKARIEEVEPLQRVADAQRQDMKVFVRDPATVEALADLLQREQADKAGSARGEIVMVVIEDEGAQEIDIALPGRYPISTRFAGAVQAIRGVVSVELL